MNTKRLITMLVSTLIAFAFSACAGGTLLISNKTKHMLKLNNSDKHDFSKVHMYYENNKLVLYGKVKSKWDYCKCERAVRMQIKGTNNETLFSKDIVLVDRGYKKKGWYGAHFRIRLDVSWPKQAPITLSFEDTKCKTGI